MIEINTNISAGYLPLIEIFAKANGLNMQLSGPTKLKISYDENSDTALQITFMSIRHCGLENMLCDYLIRCDVHPQQIPVGRFIIRKDPKQLEEEWQDHRKKIGLAR